MAARVMPHDNQRLKRGTKREPYWCPRCSEPFDFFDELATHAHDRHRVLLRPTFSGKGS